jgi:hypothetical protein
MQNPFRSKSNNREHVIEPKETGLGTFGGSFTHSILTILGVIMYLRFGWVVGNVGLIGSLIIVTIAPILSMFFLTTYGVLNIAAGTERLLGSPSFRPKFKVHWIFSLLGAIGCISVMFLINAVATGIVLAFVAIIYTWLESRELKTTWGDVRRGIWMAMIRAGLMRLDDTEEERLKDMPTTALVLAGEEMSFGEVLLQQDEFQES